MWPIKSVIEGYFIGLLVVFSIAALWSFATPQFIRPEPPHRVTYCIDPWASADLGWTVYGPCKTVNPLRIFKA